MQVPDNVFSASVGCTGDVARLPNVPCRLVYLQAATSNAGSIIVGGSSVTDGGDGLQLAAGEKLPAMLVDNLNRLYVYGAEGDLLHYLVIR